MTEQAALYYFWLQAERCQGRTARLGLLGELADVTVRRPLEWDRKAIRRAFEAGRLEARLDRQFCFACGAGKGLAFHHVVTINHGGSNDLRNQVPLCADCHKQIHPWLVDRPPVGPIRGFESVGRIVLWSPTVKALLKREVA